ncbi:MAG TPA: hypothetical protein VFU83_03805 [Pyrinomonadaceae bacterium]|nr:hypothetical protein [Pyrinomonadaceae bacterium]
MKSLLVALLITLGLMSSVSAQEHSSRPPKLPPNTSTPANPATTPNTANSVGWTKFTSDEGRFSVVMPGTPEDKVETKPSDHGPYTTHLFILRNQEHVFLIGYVDYDPSFNFNLQAELEMNRDNFIKGLGVTLLTTRSLKIDGYSVIEFTAEGPQKIFTSRVYMVGRRPYQIVIGSPKGVDDSVNINRFFNSFKVSLN